MNWRYAQDGDERVRRKFFLFPDFIGGRGYWLECRLVRQKYHSCVYCEGWKNIEVID